MAYSVTSRPDRRTFVAQSITSATIGAATFLSQPSSTMAATDDEDVVTTTPSDDGFITTESGLRYKVVTVGSGAIPTPGQTVKAHYTGTLSIFMYRIIKRVNCHCCKTLQKSNKVSLSLSDDMKKVGWMDLILPKSLIPVGIVVVHFNLPSVKDKSFGYVHPVKCVCVFIYVCECVCLYMFVSVCWTD